MKLSNRRRDGLRIGSPYAHRTHSSSQTANLLVNKTTITGSFVFIVAFFAAFFSSSVLAPTHTSDASDLVTAKVTPTDYYVKVSSNDVPMQLLTTPSGTMTVVTSTTKAATNSPNGYKLYLGMSPVDPTGAEKTEANKQKNGLYLDGDLSREDGELFAAASGTGGATTSATPAALGNNTWGYAVDKDTEGAPVVWRTENHTTMSSATPTDDKFAGVPTVGNDELIQETTTGNVPYETPEEDVEDSDYTTATIYYGIRGNSARSAGIYSNTVAYTAIANGAAPSEDITLSPSIYTRSQPYESMTWTDTLTITTDIYTSSQDLGTATITLTGGPTNDSFTCANPTLSSVNNTLVATCTLPAAYAGNYKISATFTKYGKTYSKDYTYAVNWNSISAMQEMTTAVCNSVSTPAVSATSVPEKFLTDLRGGGGHINPTTGAYQEAYTGKYRIRKLADGNCWMTENMDLPIGESTTFHSYDSNLTAIPDSTITESGTYGTYTNTDGIIAWTPKNVVDTSTCTTGAAHCSPNTTGPATSNSWCYNTNGAPKDTNIKNAHNYQGPGCTYGTPGALSTKYIDDNDGNRQGVGTLYNWPAATAQSGGDTAGTNAINSVCPKGWKLPSGEGVSTGNKSFATLMNTYGYADDSTGSAAARKAPLSLVYSGLYYWGDGYLSYQGLFSYLWSSSPYTSASNAYRLNVDSSRLVPQSINSKAGGVALRCVSL